MTAAVVIDQDGDVVTPRRRERNAGRVLEVLPPSPEVKVAALQRMTSDQQIQHVTDLVSKCASGLSAAIAAQDINAIRHAKDQFAAIDGIVQHLRLSESVELSATEFRRRAERALGLAIRAGQARGDIRARGEKMFRGNQYAKQDVTLITKPSPTDFAPADELAACKNGIYALTDGVTDEQFEKAIQDALIDRKLTRANLVRKLHENNAAEVVPASPVVKQDERIPKRRLTKHDSTEMLANINGMLNGIVESLPFIDPADIDPAENKNVINNIRHSMGKIRALLKGIDNV